MVVDYRFNFSAKNLHFFRLCHQNVMRFPLVTEHVPLRCKSLCKNMARSSGECSKYAPTKPGSTKGEDPNFQCQGGHFLPLLNAHMVLASCWFQF